MPESSQNSAPPPGGISHTAELPRIQVQTADTAEQKELIYRFRYNVYVEEMGKRTDSYADHKNKRLTDELDETGTLFYAESNGQLLGTLRVNRASTCPISEKQKQIYRLDLFNQFDPAAFSFTSRLMILKEGRGSMALHMLLTYAYENRLDHELLFDFCNCSPSLVELYEHLGYRRYMDNFVDPEVGYRIPLVMLARDAEHLKTIRSPFWRKLRNREALWADPQISQWFSQTFTKASEIREWKLGEEEFFHFLADKYKLATQSQPIALLKGLSPNESGEVMRGAVLSCQQDDHIIRIGDVGREMFVILSGSVAVRNSRGKTLAEFDTGHVIGEISSLLQITRTANVVAKEPSEILVLTRERIDRLMKVSPKLAAKLLYNLSHILAERLVSTTRMLSDEEFPAARDTRKPIQP